MSVALTTSIVIALIFILANIGQSGHIARLEQRRWRQDLQLLEKEQTIRGLQQDVDELNHQLRLTQNLLAQESDDSYSYIEHVAGAEAIVRGEN